MKFREISKIFRFGIRQKVILVLILVLLFALNISSWVQFEKEKTNTIEAINQRGSDISRFVSKSLAFSVIGYDYHTVQLLLDEIIQSDDISYAKVENKKGNTMGESGVKPNISPNDILTFTEDILLNQDTVGKLTLSLSTTKTLQQLKSNKFSLLTREALIILLIAIGEFLALSYIIIRPVSMISKSLNDNIDENGQITGDIPLNSNDEFGQLAKKFNQLLSKLNSANLALQSKNEMADSKLIDTNIQLVAQSKALKKLNNQFRKLSITDSLTGLYNRRHFEDLMETEISMSLRYGDTNSLLIFDIDYFKRINDEYGHQCGDAVLIEFSTILGNCLRKTDILCRIGGEEFVAFCKRANCLLATEIGEKIRKTIAQHQFNIGEKSVYITTSIGIATFPDINGATNRQKIFKHADIALYKSKHNGRNMTTHYRSISIDQQKNRESKAV